jgi:hypothetical protein
VYTNKPEYEALIAQFETLPEDKWQKLVDLKEDEMEDRYNVRREPQPRLQLLSLSFALIVDFAA